MSWTHIWYIQSVFPSSATKAWEFEIKYVISTMKLFSPTVLTSWSHPSWFTLIHWTPTYVKVRDTMFQFCTAVLIIRCPAIQIGTIVTCIPNRKVEIHECAIKNECLEIKFMFIEKCRCTHHSSTLLKVMSLADIP